MKLDREQLEQVMESIRDDIRSDPVTMMDKMMEGLRNAVWTYIECLQEVYPDSAEAVETVGEVRMTCLLAVCEAIGDACQTLELYNQIGRG